MKHTASAGLSERFDATDNDRTLFYQYTNKHLSLLLLNDFQQVHRVYLNYLISSLITVILTQS